MIGDNVYGDGGSEDLSDLRRAYNQQKENFKILDLNFPIAAIWDDHDYGLNDGGKRISIPGFIEGFVFRLLGDTFKRHSKKTLGSLPSINLLSGFIYGSNYFFRHKIF